MPRRKVNMSHQPLPALGWPAMTMDFDVAPSVDLSRIKPGSRVNFSLEKDKGGMYQIQSIEPANGRR
jgi:Cu(I)/Ag(I) efflux system periplasmic protein CusF